MSSETLLERAKAVAPLINEFAQASLEKRTLTDEAVDALAKAGLFHMLMPKELGGSEPEISEVLNVLEVIAHADGASGWTLMANSAATGFAGACLSDEAVAEIFDGGNPSRVVGGMFGPMGKGLPDGDGYRISGNFRFGTGTNHCYFIAAGFLPIVDGRPVMSASGSPDMRISFVPRSAVDFKDNWHVMGLQGTGSYDYEVRDEPVKNGFQFAVYGSEVKRGGPMFRVGMMPIIAASHGAWALGVAKRALEEVACMAKGKYRAGHVDSLSNRLTFQVEYSRNAMRLKAARALLHEVCNEAQDAVFSGSGITPKHRANVRAAVAYVTESAKKVCDFMHAYAGTDASRLGNSMVRAYLDMQVGSQHYMVNENVLADSAKILLGNVPDISSL